jgi:hypothetical protein
MFRRAILGVLCAIGLGNEASAAVLLEETLRNGHVALHLTGGSIRETPPCSKPRRASSPRLAKRIDVVSLNSTGGQLGEGALIAAVLRR